MNEPLACLIFAATAVAAGVLYASLIWPHEHQTHEFQCDWPDQVNLYTDDPAYIFTGGAHHPDIPPSQQPTFGPFVDCTYLP